MRLFGLLFAAAILVGAASSTRVLKLDDLARFHDVSDPQVSPDGQWVAYTVSTVDEKDDKRDTDVWMVSWDGTKNVRLTYSTESESSPRWSPDGKYLSFTSSRPGKAKGNQVWLLDRLGGEARQLTELKARLSEYEWSPDSKRLALVLRDPDEPEPEPARARETRGARSLPLQAGYSGLLERHQSRAHLPLRHRDEEVGSADAGEDLR